MSQLHMPKNIILFGHRSLHGKDECCNVLEEICDEKGYTRTRTYFAKLLKRQTAERYNLDPDRMNDQDYKSWCPPWVSPRKTIVDYTDLAQQGFTVSELKVGHTYHYQGLLSTVLEKDEKELTFSLNVPRTVRQLLIEEGALGRSIWEDVWANSAYQDIFKWCDENNTSPDVAMVSDFRFPNEYNCFSNSLKSYIELKSDKIPAGMVKIREPKLWKVLVERPAAKFVNDGADDKLPDRGSDYWDFEIINEEVDKWKELLNLQINNILTKIGVNDAQNKQNKMFTLR